MNIPAEKEYINAVLYVLNKIKKGIIFDPENKSYVDYMLDLNIMRHQGISLLQERNVLQKLKNEKIISEIEEFDMAEINEIGTPQYKVYEIRHFKVLETFNDYYDQYYNNQNGIQNICWFDNNTFFLKLYDGSLKAISFDTQRGNRQMLALFQTIIEHWKKHGNQPITATQIVSRMNAFGSDVEASKLKDIFSNIRNKKIKPANLEDKLSMDFDRTINGWKVNIKR